VPPLEPPTGEGPGTLAVRRMSGREPGRFIAFWNAVFCVFVVIVIVRLLISVYVCGCVVIVVLGR